MQLIQDSDIQLEAATWGNSAFVTNKDEINHLEKKRKGIESEIKFFFKQLMDLAAKGQVVHLTSIPTQQPVHIPGTGGPETNYQKLYSKSGELIVMKIMKNIGRLKQHDQEIMHRIKEITIKGHTFVFTGFRDADMEGKITKLGGRVTSAVSNKTDFVVASDPDDNTGKVQKAKHLGVSVMSKQKMAQILR